MSPDKDYFYASRIDLDFHKSNARPLHQHSFFELLIVLKGSIMQKLEDKKYLYPAGACCLVNQNIFYIEKYIGEAQLLFIGVSVNFIRELLESHKTVYFQKEETAYYEYEYPVKKGEKLSGFSPGLPKPGKFRESEKAFGCINPFHDVSKIWFHLPDQGNHLPLKYSLVLRTVRISIRFSGKNTALRLKNTEIK